MVLDVDLINTKILSGSCLPCHIVSLLALPPPPPGDRQTSKGNVVNWETARFDLVNVTEVEAPMASICKPIRPGHVIMPIREEVQRHKS